MKPRFNPAITYLFFCVALQLNFTGLPPVIAEERFLTAACPAGFPEAMSHLQELIKNQGYTISRVQYVDKGLRSRGYETGRYRVVFFGKRKQIQEIRTRYPVLIPYIPLSITIFEQSAQTGISTIDPATFNQLYKASEIKNLIESWHLDIMDIFSEYQHCDL